MRLQFFVLSLKTLFIMFMLISSPRIALADCGVSGTGEYFMTYDSSTKYLTACTFGGSLQNVCSSDSTACPTAGALNYDTANNVMRYCKNTNWANIDCFDSGNACTAGEKGKIAVNSDQLQYCNGTKWMEFIFNGICSGIGVQEATITPALAGEGTANTLFGWEDTIAITDDFAITGMFYGTNSNGMRSGVASIYQRSGSTWTRLKELSRTSAGRFEYYGRSVDMYGDYAAVSADQGKEVFIYKKDQGGVNNWGELKRVSKGWERYGYNVDLSSDHLIVGASLYDYSGLTDAGGVVIYRKDRGSVDGWGEVTSFLHPIPAEAGNSRFGQDVAIDGDVAAVGAYANDVPGFTNAGAVFLYQETSLDTWSYLKKLENPYGYGVSDYYGYAVAIDDIDDNGTADRLAVGAYLDDQTGGDAGSIFVYERDQGGANNWGLVKSISLAAPGTSYHLGREMRLIGDRIFAASRLNDDLASNAGAVLIFQKDQGGANNWGLENTIYASDAETLDYFGYSLAVSNSGNYILSATPYKDNGNTHPGKAYPFVRSGSNWTEQTPLLPSTSIEFSARMGDAVSVSGDYLATGMVYKSDLFTNGEQQDVGTVNIFIRDAGGNWSFSKEITPQGPSSGMVFGSPLQITPTILVVSVPGDDSGASNSGGAHVYGRDVGGANNWGFVKELKASDRQSNDAGGGVNGLSLSGDYVALGAYGEDGTLIAPDVNAGAAYIFKKDSGGVNNWGEIKAIKPPLQQDEAQFGRAVDIGGQYLLVAAPYEDNVNGTNAGTVYLYEKDNGGADNWGYTGKSFVGQAANDQFGYSVAVAGYTIAIGALLDDTVTGNAGAVYIYEKDFGGVNNWGLRKKILHPGSTAGDAYFGQSVDLAGDVLIVGAPRDDTFATNAGRVFVYSRDEGGADNWGLLASIDPVGSNADDEFGRSVAVSGNVVAAGGIYIDDAGIDDGGIYVYGCASGGPNAYDFTDRASNQNNWAESNIVTITGLSGSVGVSISGDGTPEFRINGGAWVTSDTISNNDTLQLRLLTSTGPASLVATVDVNGVTDTYTVNVIAAPN